MSRLLTLLLLLLCPSIPAFVVSAKAAEIASGFAATPAPLERQLAEQPEPNSNFRAIISYWHGVPGLASLQKRWESFAAANKNFAVLAALVSEFEGNPEETLGKLQALQGSDARWNEARILALLGKEAAAAAMFSSLVTTAENPDIGAAALIALTERDCLRAEFSSALQRTSAAWDARPEEAFRLRILERHVSLLVEAGKERQFIDEQTAHAENTANPATAKTAQRVMAIMADWFTKEARLQGAQKSLARTHVTHIAQCRHRGCVRPTMECGNLYPQGTALAEEGQNSAASLLTAFNLAQAISTSGNIPDDLEDYPLLKRAFTEMPLSLASRLFSTSDAIQPLPHLAKKIATIVEPNAARLALDFMVRSYAGQATPADAETLATIIVEAPQFRTLRRLIRRYPFDYFDQWEDSGIRRLRYPCETVVWNHVGEEWNTFYRASCRLSPLTSLQTYWHPETIPRVRDWAQLRPKWPTSDAEATLIHWAWQQLRRMGQATPERALSIAHRITDPSDRFQFAIITQQKELLQRWVEDKSLLPQVTSAILMDTVNALQENRQSPVTPETVVSILALANELATRMKLDPLDLMRSRHIFYAHTTNEQKQQIQSRPVNLEATFGLAFSHGVGDEATTKLAASLHPQTRPNLFYGLHFSPSVERFRFITNTLRSPHDNFFRGFRSNLQSVVTATLALSWRFEQELPPPSFLQALEASSSPHPLKRQYLRWSAIRAPQLKNDNSSEHGMSGSAGRLDSVDAKLKQALLTLAEEEQASLTWQIIRALLEDDEAKKTALLSAAVARSPLAEGLGEQLLNRFIRPEPTIPEDPTVLKKKARDTAEAMHAIFLQILANTEHRKALEPLGAMKVWLTTSEASEAFLLGTQKLTMLSASETAELLLASSDPLSARMALHLISIHHPSETQAAWLARALVRFPHDPEILIASAILGHSNDKTTPASNQALRQGFAHTTELIRFEKDTVPYFCGINASGVVRDGESAYILSSYVEKGQPATLPSSWIKGLERVLLDRAELEKMTDDTAQSIAAVVGRFQPPFERGQGSYQGWLSRLDTLCQAGREKVAIATAEGLLSQAKGTLSSPYGPDEPAPPWENVENGQVTGTVCEGWQLLMLAGSQDPEGLALRLHARAVAHPADEHLTLSALLARGSLRPLSDLDLALTAHLTLAGRHRVLAYASWLLPPDKLPRSLVFDSWEAEAAVEFSDVSNGSRNFQHGLGYLDQLEKAGALDAVRRLLPNFLEAVKT